MKIKNVSLDPQTKKTLIIFIGIILLFVVVDGLIYFPKNIVLKAPAIPSLTMPKFSLTQFQTESSKKPQLLGAKTSVLNQNPTQKLIEAVGQLINLPKDEAPMVATVTDPKQLQDQAFFKQAALGDKVLAYKKTKLVILYRPGDNKIINMSQAEFELKTNKKLLTPADTQATVSGEITISPEVNTLNNLQVSP